MNEDSVSILRFEVPVEVADVIAGMAFESSTSPEIIAGRLLAHGVAAITNRAGEDGGKIAGGQQIG